MLFKTGSPAAARERAEMSYLTPSSPAVGGYLGLRISCGSLLEVRIVGWRWRHAVEYGGDIGRSPWCLDDER